MALERIWDHTVHYKRPQGAILIIIIDKADLSFLLMNGLVKTLIKRQKLYLRLVKSIYHRIEEFILFNN